MRGGISSVAPVVSGVPQGTVLGPLLFLILMSDISNNVTSSSIVSFADDNRLYLDIKDVSNRNTLQDYLNTVYSWATDINMKFNENNFIMLPLAQPQSCRIILVLLPVVFSLSQVCSERFGCYSCSKLFFF